MSYAQDTHAPHLRLPILRLLNAEDGGYSANDSVINDALPAVGFRVSRDRVRTAMAWLGEQGFVRIEKFDQLVVVTITARGIEVAQGTVSVPGVKRPSPH